MFQIINKKIYKLIHKILYMTLSKVVRKNISKISSKERDDLINAIISLNINSKFVYPGNRDDKPFVGGVSFWFKQDEIHQATHVHRGPAFLTWHRELCNRFERLLRMSDKNISLHYWDWNEDLEKTIDSDDNIINLFTDQFMGNSKGEAGEPWLGNNFYNPHPIEDKYRGIESFDIEHNNPADPPLTITRDKQYGTLHEFMERNDAEIFTDEDIIKSYSYSEMRFKLEYVHNWAHSYIGGTIGDPHTSFRDPFVFLIHSNVDRLFSAWQRCKNFEWRLDPEQVYGEDKETVALGSTSPRVVVGIQTLLSPWCGIGYPFEYINSKTNLEEEPGVNDVRPWTYPENWHRNPNIPNHEKAKNSLDISIIQPTLYYVYPNGDKVEYNHNNLSDQN
jgi:hypothetical protein